MFLPTYNDDAVFGTGVTMTRDIAPRAVQRNAYAGLSGVESLDLGGRGRYTQVGGIIEGPDLDTFEGLKALLESYHDGVPRDFRDTSGIVWANCLMGSPQFQGRLCSAGARGFYQPYSVVVEHLTGT